MKGHTGPVFSLAFGANGKLLVSGGPTTAAWSPDQTLLAAADLDGGISLWGLR